MVGFESIWALTREAMMLTGGGVVEASPAVLGLEGRRPRRPLRLSVRTTKRWKWKKEENWRLQYMSRILTWLSLLLSLSQKTTALSISIYLFLQLAP